jgi:hypothetical protein
MLSHLRKRLGIPGVISVIALVLAMTGGAFAASKFIITKKNQIAPKVLKELKGNTGPAGANGTNGANGAPGAAGANGLSVTNTKLNPGNEECPEGGAEFKVGSGTPTFACTGEEGEEGETGPPGPEGSPWVAGSIPPGSELRGTWAVNTNAAAAEFVYTAISTGVPLETGVAVMVRAPGGFGPIECPGTADEPLPAINTEEGNAPVNGVLCFYTKESTNIDPEVQALRVALSRGGAVVRLKTSAAGVATGFGSWAMYAF